VSPPPVHPEIGPPAFLQLAGHPLRWRLLSDLARSDLRVHELTALAGQPQNAVSYHLARLRAAGLVTMHRSSADRRDSYYRIDLARCGDLLAATAHALHPGLLPALPPPAAHAGSRSAPVRVLFLCTGNSARSQIAEALLQQAGGDLVQAASAGSHPKALHPDAVRVLGEHGIDWSGRHSKHLSEFAARRLDLVITLCDRVREICPEFPGGAEAVHWSIPDPAAARDDAVGYPAFQATAADLSTRIGFLVRRITPAAAR
jgi:ArsR family transcriptional regulator, arsenate/arsenite/antimonite-responsive transcriptional repressor / arsenate reductase (thioredoxin)